MTAKFNLSAYLAIIPIILMVGIIVFTSIKRNSAHHHIFGHKHGESVFSVDQYAHDSKLASISPKFKVFLSFSLLIICIISNNFWVSIFIIFLCAYITIVLGGLAPSKYLNLLTIPLFFMITGSIIIMVNFSTKYPIDALGVLNCNWFYIYITSKGINRVLNLWGRAFGAISAMYLLTLSTPSNEIFTVLESLHCPTLIIELMNMMYRFIFTMMETYVEMNNAAQSRLGYYNYKASLSTFGHIGSNLLIVSFKKANDYYDALESRLYNGKLNFLIDDKKVTSKQILAAIIIYLYLAAIYFL